MQISRKSFVLLGILLVAVFVVVMIPFSNVEGFDNGQPVVSNPTPPATTGTATAAASKPSSAAAPAPAPAPAAAANTPAVAAAPAVATATAPVAPAAATSSPLSMASLLPVAAGAAAAAAPTKAPTAPAQAPLPETPITSNADLMKVTNEALAKPENTETDMQAIKNIQSRIAALDKPNARTLVSEIGNYLVKPAQPDKPPRVFLKYMNWFASNYPVDK
jgi:hypothetical protein